MKAYLSPRARGARGRGAGAGAGRFGGRGRDRIGEGARDSRHPAAAAARLSRLWPAAGMFVPLLRCVPSDADEVRVDSDF